MAEVNQFEKPLASNFKDTYVSQYVPLPFDVLNKRIEDEQKKWDDNKDEAYKFLSTMGDKTLKWDSPVMRNKVKELTTTIDNGLKNNKGDWSSMDQTIRNASQEYRNFVTTGPGAVAMSNLKTREEFNKRVDANEKMGDYGMLAKRGADRIYGSHAEDNGLTPAEKGIEYKPLPLYEAVDFSSSLDDLAVKMKETGISNSDYDIDPSNGELVINRTEHSSKLSAEKIKLAWETSLKRNDKFRSMLDAQYAILQANGEEGFRYKGYDGEVSYEDFVNNEIAKRTQGSKAFEHSDKTTSYNTNTRPGGEGAAAKRQAAQTITVEFSTSVVKDPKQMRDVNSSGDFRLAARGLTTNLWSDLADKYHEAHPELARDNFNGFMSNAGKTVYGNGFDFNNAVWQLRLQKDLAFGRVKPEQLNVKGTPIFNSLHPSEFREFRANAEEAFYKAKNMSHMYIDVLDDKIETTTDKKVKEELSKQKLALEKHFENVYETEDSNQKELLPFYIDPSRGIKYKEHGTISEDLYNAFVTLQNSNYDNTFKNRINLAKSSSYNTQTADDVKIVELGRDGKVVKDSDGRPKLVRLGGENSFYKNITDADRTWLMETKFNYLDEKKEVAQIPLKTIISKELNTYMDSGDVKKYLDNFTDVKEKAAKEQIIKQTKEKELLNSIKLVKNTSDDKNYILSLPGRAIGSSSDYSTEIKKGKDAIYSSLENRISDGTKYEMEVGRLKQQAITSPTDKYEYAPGIYGVRKLNSTGTIGKTDAEVSIKIDPEKIEKWLGLAKGTIPTGNLILNSAEADEFLNNFARRRDAKNNDNEMRPLVNDLIKIITR